MGPWLIGFLLGVGGGTFIWSKSMKETNHHSTSLIIGGVVGVIIFLVVGTLLKFIIGFK